MALLNRLENNDASTTYDLLSSSNLQYVEGSLRSNRGRDGLTTTTMRLYIKETAANIRAAVNNLIDLLETAVSWHNNKVQDGAIWWRLTTDGETAKRSLIYRYELQPLDTGADSPFLHQGATSYQLAITHAEWESVSSSTATTGSGAAVSSVGGQFDISGDISGGELDGRIDQLSFTSGSVAPRKLWAGIRPVNKGVSTFDPVWECEDYTIKSVDTDVFADANASGGYVMRSQFSSAGGVDEMSVRFYCKLDDNSALSDVDDMIGEYLLLLRYQVTGAGTELAVKMSSGKTPYATNLANEIQYIEWTNSKYYYLPVGKITIGERISSTADALIDLTQFTTKIEAARYAGTGNLYCDCFVLMPAKHFVYLEGISTAVGSDVDVYTTPDNKIFSLAYGSSGATLLSEPTPGPENFAYPKEGGVLVLAYEEASQLLTGTVDEISLSVHKRWKYYHG